MKKIKYKLRNPNQNPFDPMQTIMENRKMSKEDLNFHLNPQPFFYDAQKLVNINRGIDLLLKHIKANNRIEVLVDGDADGFTSAAILIGYLKEVFKEFSEEHLHYHLHVNQKHGIEEDLIPDDTKLLIVPDASSSEYDIHKRLRSKGIDILIIDHHEAEKLSEHAVVVNNQLSPEYPNKLLSGASMVYLFLRELDKKFGLNIAENYCDLAAWGTLADSISLYDRETRWIVHNGLRNVKNDLLKALIDRNAKGTLLTPNVFGFKITPPLNAMIRIGNQDQKYNLFKALLNHKEITFNNRLRRDDKSEEWAERMARECANTQNKQSKMRSQIVKELSKAAINKEDVPFPVFEFPDGYEMNLSGLVAMKMVEKLRKPVLVLRKNKQGKMSGSMRGYDPFMLDTKDFLNSVPNVKAEGHPNASGVESEMEIEEIEAALSEALQDYKVDDSILVDVSIPASILDSDFIYAMDLYMPLWGKGMEEPVYVIKNVETHSKDIILKGKDKTTVEFECNGVTYIKFNDTEELIDIHLSESNYVIKLDVIGKTSINTYKGESTPQVVIQECDVKATESIKKKKGGFVF